MRNPSAVSHSFAKVKQNPIQRSSFDRSFARKTTFDTGYLIPIYVAEVLPGDVVNMDANFVARVSTMLYPIMDNLHLDTFWFYSPIRLLWENWQRFNGERATPTQSIDLEIPGLSGDGFEWAACTLGDYFGLPVGVSLSSQNVISALPFRMYNLVWNEWFRDQNLQGQAYQDKSDGPDVWTNYALLKRGKRHDIFTSCLPYPQKGDAVSIPLGTSAPVVGNGETMGFTNGSADFGIGWNDGTDTVVMQGNWFGFPVGTGAPATQPTGTLSMGLTDLASASGVIADLTQATAATVNDLREAFAIQQLLELDARGGTRYAEQIRNMWGVDVEDYRLQRPEYLGGSSNPVSVRAVANTAGGATPQAALAAYGQIGSRSGFVHSFKEHGYLMCLVNVRADITYQQGLNRMWTRATRYDFYQPPLAHLGEEPIFNKEIYYQDDPLDEEVFGYQERWSHYRVEQNMVTGVFRSSHSQTLDAWHLALNFTALPELDSAFIQDAPPFARVTAINEATYVGQQVLMDMYAHARWARPLPVFSTPGLERL